MNRETCDKCGGKIENGKCSCGFWYESHEEPPGMKILEKAINYFAFLRDQNLCGPVFSGDHHSGHCMVLFDGDYDDCVIVVKFIRSLQNDKRKE